MLIIQKDESGYRHAIASGFVTGRFKSFKNSKGFTEIYFTLVYKTMLSKNIVEKIKVVAFGDEVVKYVQYAKRNRANLLLMGNCVIDKEETEKERETRYMMYANVVFSPTMFVELYNYFQGSMRFDKQIEKIAMGLNDTDRIASGIRYDYDSALNPEDHMI